MSLISVPIISLYPEPVVSKRSECIVLTWKAVHHGLNAMMPQELPLCLITVLACPHLTHCSATGYTLHTQTHTMRNHVKQRLSSTEAEMEKTIINIQRYSLWYESLKWPNIPVFELKPLSSSCQDVKILFVCSESLKFPASCRMSTPETTTVSHHELWTFLKDACTHNADVLYFWLSVV